MRPLAATCARPQVRGVRIQPEEIEARLKRFTARDGSMPIAACAAVPCLKEPIELTAFLETAPTAAAGTAAEDASGGVASGSAAIDVAAVRAFLVQELGRVYVPKHIVWLASGLPRTASGKPDQAALKKLATAQEMQQAQQWQQGTADGGGALSRASDATSAADADADVAADADTDADVAADANVDAADATSSAAPSSAVLGAPIAHSALGSGARRWEIDLSSRLWGFLADHQYRGEALFPGSGYVALAAEVGETTWPGAWELRELRFVKPLPLAAPRRTLVLTAAPPATPDSTHDTSVDAGVVASAGPANLELTLASVETGVTAAEPLLHCTCTCVHLQAAVPFPAATPSPPSLAPPSAPLQADGAAGAVGEAGAAREAIGQLPSLPYPASQLYAQLADSGFNYGPEFRLLRSAYRCTAADAEAAASGMPVHAWGEVQRRAASPFLLDPVEVDAAFHLAPLVSRLGFEGAPAAIARVRMHQAGAPGATGVTVAAPGNAWRVHAEQTSAGLTFTAHATDSMRGFDSEGAVERGRARWALEGLELGRFDSAELELLQLRTLPMHPARRPRPSASSVAAAPPPWVVAVGSAAQHDASNLATLLDAGEAPSWAPGAALAPPVRSRRSVVLVVTADEYTPAAEPAIPPAGAVASSLAPSASPLVGAYEQAEALSVLLPELQHDLPATGRVWLVVVGEQPGAWAWLGAARRWAASLPALELSLLHAPHGGLGPTCAAVLLDDEAPPYVQLVAPSSGAAPDAAASFRLERPRPTGATAVEATGVEATGVEATDATGVAAVQAASAAREALPARAADTPLETPCSTQRSTQRFAGMPLEGGVAVLALCAHPLAKALVRALQALGAAVTLMLPGTAPSQPPQQLLPRAVLLCAVGGTGDAAGAHDAHLLRAFDPVCAAATHCCTLCGMDALLPMEAPLPPPLPSEDAAVSTVTSAVLSACMPSAAAPLRRPSGQLTEADAGAAAPGAEAAAPSAEVVTAVPSAQASSPALMEAQAPYRALNEAPAPSRALTEGAASEAGAAASRMRARAGHPSWTIFAPPLTEGLWFAPAAPAVLPRCSVAALVAALAPAPAQDALVCAAATSTAAALPKHWRRSAMLSTVVAAGLVRTAGELRAFLVAELAETLQLDGASVDVSIGIDQLGVTSLASLRLSQRLRRFLGRDIPAFALQSNPSIDELVAALCAPADDGAAHPLATAPRGRVLCLHGFRTSSTVLRQQMAPVSALLEALGYELVVPDAPFKTAGPAQFAEGLDEDDSYGWWTYAEQWHDDQPAPGTGRRHGDEQREIETHGRAAHAADADDDARADAAAVHAPEDGYTSHDAQPIGLEASLASLARIGPVAGILGFSQGGAMAAQLADTLGARWALLFSPVFVPARPARCSCPTLLAYDPTDEVRAATRRLEAELPNATLTKLQHAEGHRLPVAGAWYEGVEAFLREHTSGATVDELEQGA